MSATELDDKVYAYDAAMDAMAQPIPTDDRQQIARVLADSVYMYGKLCDIYMLRAEECCDHNDHNRHDLLVIIRALRMAQKIAENEEQS